MVAWDLWSITIRLRGRSPRTRVVIVNHKSQTDMHYILQPDWSLLLLVNIQDSLYCKQGMLLVNIILQLLLYMKQNLQLPVSIWK